MASIRVEKGTWKVKDSEGNITKLYPAGKEIDSVSGSQLVIEDSRAGALRINKTFGKSEQRKTTGAQLFDASKFETTTSAGATVTTNGDGSFTISGSGTLSQDFSMFHLYSHEETLKILKAGTLIMKNEVKTRPYCYVAILGSDGNILHEINNENSTSLHVDITGELLLTDNLTMRIGFYGGTGKDIVTGTIKPMLYFDGDSDGTWEPYTGNMPAPNPQYPQEIVSTGDSGSIETKVIGNNLLSLEDRITNDRGLTQTIANGICTVSGTATSNAGFNLTLAGAYARTDVILTLPAGTYTATDCVLATYDGVNRKTYTNTFTVTEPLDITWVATRTYRVEEVVSETTYPMINVGDSTMTWEAYNEQILSINTPNGLPGIKVTYASLANYTDADGKMWCCDTREWDRGVDVKRIFTRKFENITESNIKLRTSVDGYTEAEIYGNSEMVSGFGLCDSFKYKPTGASVRFAVYYETVFFTLLGEFNTKAEWLEEFNRIAPTIHAILATPIETPIPEEEMAAWRAMHSNEPTTTILSDADVKVEYPTSRVGAVALDADMRSREVEETTFRRYPIWCIMAEQGWTNEDLMAMKTTDIAKVMQDNSIVYFTFNSTTYLCTDLPNNGGTNKGVCEITRYQSNRVLVEVDVEADGKYFMFVTNLDGSNAFMKTDTVNTIRLDDVSLLSVVENGKYYVVNATDAPLGLNGYLEVHNYPNDPNNYRKLTWSPYNNGNVIFQNILVNGAWYGWSRLFTTNDVTDNGETLVLNWL